MRTAVPMDPKMHKVTLSNLRYLYIRGLFRTGNGIRRGQTPFIYFQSSFTKMYSVSKATPNSEACRNESSTANTGLL
jgi:hypothetical protein